MADKKSPFQTRVSKSSGLSPFKQETDIDPNAESEQDLLASATEKFREYLAKNLNPYGYHDPLGRIYKAVVKGEQDPKRTRMEFTEENPSEKIGEFSWDDREGGDTENVERIDLLNIVMGQPQKYNSMQESEYRPTESKDPKATYYKSEQTEAEIKEAFKIELRGERSVDEALAKVTTSYKGEKGRRGGSVLGKYKVDTGVDEKGHYISYYDIWDLNPIPETGSDIIDIGVGKVASYLTKKAGFKSPEIYGRIYYNPETGQIIE